LKRCKEAKKDLADGKVELYKGSGVMVYKRDLDRFKKERLSLAKISVKYLYFTPYISARGQTHWRE